MVTLEVNGTAVEVEEGTTILEAARAAGHDVPTLCYLKDYDSSGACRVCCVELEGDDRLAAACNTAAAEGMKVLTASPRAEAMRKTNLELILSRHDRDCNNCDRMGTCKLQSLFLEYALFDDVYDKELVAGKRNRWDTTIPIQKATNKCILCGRCVQVCKKIQGIGVWDFLGSGARTTIGVRDHAAMAEAGCVSCGQCITHCPDGALTERDDTTTLFKALADPTVTTVVQIAPAARTAWATSLGMRTGEATVERMAAAFKALGFDYVFDTAFSADLTIMEEGTELLNVLQSGDRSALPLFTSCCPGWVTHVRNAHPDFVSHLSSAKSPMMMFGAITKVWFAEKQQLAPEKIFSVALMPCTAKKNEIRQPGAQSVEGVDDMDLSITTREFVRMIKARGIDVERLEDVPLDNPLGESTGAGMIFGTTGGVMEAALRSAHFFVTGRVADVDAFAAVRGGQPWREATFDIDGTPVRCAVVNGLAQADALLGALRTGDVAYDFVEIMACPSGCAGGGGQPIDGTDRELGLYRGEVLRTIDEKHKTLRFSHENPVVKVLYDEWLDAPCSEKAHRYLHTAAH